MVFLLPRASDSIRKGVNSQAKDQSDKPSKPIARSSLTIEVIIPKTRVTEIKKQLNGSTRLKGTLSR
jgi:hypothetical protein